MQGVFEISEYDATGRRGELRVPRADTTVQTPALLPVVNPNVRTLAPGRIEGAYPVDGIRLERLGLAAEAAARGVRRLVETPPGTSFRLCHDDRPAVALFAVPDRVTVRRERES
ncbi:hypothetical protein BRC62_06910 [Halobacteriales archaeon QH_10_67_13]|nr:MAG: hypothetical protein BRC62_06910 [Halobacteriales archaeon QH_10_67_13]